MLKQTITRLVRWAATPWRRARQRKYATAREDAPRMEFPNDAYLAVVSRYVAAGERAVIYVKGYSMRPFLEHLRDKVELAPWTDVQVGDAVLAEIEPGHYVLHRIIHREGDRLTLMGDGNVRGVEHCSLGDVRGLVTQYIRPGGDVLDAADPQLRRRIRRWRRLLPLRRPLLFIYKATV